MVSNDNPPTRAVTRNKLTPPDDVATYIVNILGSRSAGSKTSVISLSKP